MASDTKSLIELAVTRFLAEVPALANLKLVAGLEFRARGEPQMYRVELPGPKTLRQRGERSEAPVRSIVEEIRHCASMLRVVSSPGRLLLSR